MSTRPYPSYKDSGAQWLAEIPSTWGLGRIKDSVELAKNGVWGDEPDGSGDDIWCVRVADFDRVSFRVNPSSKTTRKVLANERVHRVLNRGDLLLEKSGGGEKTPVGSVVLYDFVEPAVCSNFIGRVSLSPGMVPKYWAFLHAAAHAVGLTQRSIKQTSGIQNLDQAAYFDEVAPFPPLDEQRQIADYLDVQTAKIDALVGKQEQLIETLAERRQAVISHAVTKGLDPNAPMKDSGVEWADIVPKTWTVTRLKRRWDVIDCNHVTAEFVAEGYPLASIRECQSKWVNLQTAKRTTKKYYQKMAEGPRKPRYRDLIFTRNATVGSVAQVPANIEAFAMGQDVCLLRSRDSKQSPDFYQYMLRSSVVASQIESLLIGSTFKRINIEQIRQFVVAAPGASEQLEIVAFLDAGTAKIDALSAKAREMIDVLKERRQALISAAVTGKIDVRGLV